MLRKLNYAGLVLVLALSLLSLISCHQRTEKIAGNGNKETVSRSVEPFQSIVLAGDYDVVLIGDMPQHVSLTADSNVLNYLSTEVKRGALVISVRPQVIINSKEPPLVQIYLPKLQNVSISGLGRVNASKINSDALSVRIAGTGRFNVSGTVNKMAVAISGASVVNAADLAAKQVDVDVSGTGKVSVNTQQELNVKVSGTGLVEYYGSPSKITQNITGSGKVIGISANAQENPS